MCVLDMSANNGGRAICGCACGACDAPKTCVSNSCETSTRRWPHSNASRNENTTPPPPHLGICRHDWKSSNISWHMPRESNLRYRRASLAKASASCGVTVARHRATQRMPPLASPKRAAASWCTWNSTPPHHAWPQSTCNAATSSVPTYRAGHTHAEP